MKRVASTTQAPGVCQRQRSPGNAERPRYSLLHQGLLGRDHLEEALAKAEQLSTGTLPDALSIGAVGEWRRDHLSQSGIPRA